MRRPRIRLPLRARLVIAQCLVVVAGAVTAGVVAAAIGPSVFHSHLLAAGVDPGGEALAHAEEAYAVASTTALLAAGLIAVAASVLATGRLAAEITRPLVTVAQVVTRLADGDYTARAPRAGGAPEVEALADTVNDVAQRLQTTEETRRRLIGDLAHEMRTPVATLAAHLDALDDGVVAWSPEVSRVLHDQEARLARLARDMAEVSRAEEGGLAVVPEPHRAGRLVAAAVAAARPSYEAVGVRLEAPASETDDDEVLADGPRIHQVLGNLLENALRHTPVGGAVTVTVARDAGPGAGAGVRISVADTGEGIDPAELPHVFERFYRGGTATARDRGGSGVGLTIARAIAVAHRGSLTARSAGPGRGAAFDLVLPAAPHPR